MVGRNKTLRGCAIKPPKEDNIIHTREPKCDETFSVQTYQIWTNQYVMNNYIMLLIMREWFCLDALWKVKNSHEKTFMMKRKSVLYRWKFLKFCCTLKIKNLIKMFRCSVKIKFLMKVQVYVKKLSAIFSLWNIKFDNYESYNIL